MSEITTLTLHHPQGDTPIYVGAGALAACRPDLATWIEGRTVFVVASAKVRALHGGLLEEAMAGAAQGRGLDVPDGEEAKELGVAQRLWAEMLSGGGKRDSRVIAFGGGSVGDLTGFVAGCFLRGVEFVQVPTTLLAQVDAAVGGKTGINQPAGKNTIGLFYHPRMVVADTELLRTLPEPEIRSGLVEVLKMGIVSSIELFNRLEEKLGELLAGDAKALAPVVAAAIQGKIEIVERDPTEQGERRLLNLGHTLGHALETSMGYRALRHGEAVAYGTLFAIRLASRRGELDRATAERIRGLLSRFRLPELPELAAGELMEIIARDKKARESGLSWILPRQLGQCEIVADIAESEVLQELEPFLADPFVG
ncbi:MAG: 3-dehydroquinate synthase [Thermoanaerobaculia bacterium]